MEEDAPPPTIKQEEGISLPGFDYKVDGMDEDAPMDELNALHDETFTAVSLESRCDGLEVLTGDSQEIAKRRSSRSHREP